MRIKPVIGHLVQPLTSPTRVNLGSMFFGDYGSRQLGLIIETRGTEVLVWCADNFDVWVQRVDVEVLA